MNKQVIPIRNISATGKDSDTAVGFTLKQIDLRESQTPKKQPLHRHNFFYLLLLEKGAGKHMIDFESYPVHDWTLYLMRPGQVHMHELNPGSHGWLIAFQAYFYPTKKDSSHFARLNQIFKYNHLVIPRNSRSNLREVIHQIHAEIDNQQEGFEEIIKSYLSIFFTHIYRIQSHEKPLKPTDHGAQIYDLQLLIEKHMCETKKVSAYAEMMNLTVYQLNSITKSSQQKTCSEFIADQVILEAKRQLLATNDLVSEVAYDLGYHDPAYFIRFFKKQTGTTPKQFQEDFDNSTV